MTKALLTMALCTSMSISTQASDNKGGITGQKAPAITVDQWVSLPEGAKAPTAKSLEGKVVYLYCFQSWCPGCHSSGFPTLQKVHSAFAKDPDVVCMAIQTAFEGFSKNTPQKAAAMAKKYKLESIPFGHSGSKAQRSAIMTGFKTRGTPWTIIIGKDGVVRYNAFHIKPDAAIELIKKLKK